MASASWDDASAGTGGKRVYPEGADGAAAERCPPVARPATRGVRHLTSHRLGRYAASHVLSVLATLALVAIALWLFAASALFLLQRRLLYPKLPLRPLGSPRGLERIHLPVGDGVVPCWIAARAGAPWILFFHGNGEQLADSLPIAQSLARRGLAFAAVEYPGYGESTATRPTEAKLVEVARLALGELRARGANVVVCIGHSLGSGPAAWMAAEGRCEGLALVAPFTSVGDIGQARYPWLPARLLARDRFDTLARAPQIRVPTWVTHGRDDTTVPFDMGERIASAIAGARWSVRTKGHGDILDEATLDAVAALAWSLGGRAPPVPETPPTPDPPQGG